MQKMRKNIIHVIRFIFNGRGLRSKKEYFNIQQKSFSKKILTGGAF